MGTPSRGRQTAAVPPKKTKIVQHSRLQPEKQFNTSNCFISEVLIVFVHDIHHKIMDQQRFPDWCDEQQRAQWNSKQSTPPEKQEDKRFQHGKAVFDTHINRRMIIIDPGPTKGQVIH